MLTIIHTKPVKTITGAICTTDEAKKQLQIEDTFTDDDYYIDTLIAVAQEQVTDDTNSDVVDTANVLTYKIGNEGESGPETVYRIPQAPLQSVTKIETSTNGTTWTQLAATDYAVTSTFTHIIIGISQQLSASSQWLKFTYKTGYAAADLPMRLKQAALVKVVDLFNSERQGYNLPGEQETTAYAKLIAKHIRTYW